MASGKKKLSKKNIIIMITFLIIIFSLIIILTTIFVSNWLTQKRVVGTIVSPIAVITPIKGEINKSITVNGYIDNESTVDVIPMATGKILSIRVKEGSSVKKGDLLATIDDASLKVMLTQAENAYTTALSAYNRVKSLYNQQITSKQDYEIAQNNYKMALSQYEAIKLQHQQTRVVAPIDGIIVYLIGKIGALASPQMPLLRISNPKTVVITNSIPDKYYETFAKKYRELKVVVKRPNSSELLNAKIISIASYIDFQSKTFKVKSAFSKTTAKLVPGMFVKSEFVLESYSNIYILPFNVLVANNKLWVVERDAEDENFAVVKEIEFEPTIFNEDYFEIPEEYVNKEFVCEGQEFIYENQRVKITQKNGVPLVENVTNDDI